MKHNRLIAFLLVVIMLLCIGAAAETYRVETPNKGTLNLRSVKDNSVIGRIPNGTLLEPDPEKSTETAAYVTYNGKSGYAKWEFLKRVETNDVSELPTGGDGDWFVGAIGAYIQPGLEGDAYGEQFGSRAAAARRQVSCRPGLPADNHKHTSPLPHSVHATE